MRINSNKNEIFNGIVISLLGLLTDARLWVYECWGEGGAPPVLAGTQHLSDRHWRGGVNLSWGNRRVVGWGERACELTNPAPV